jgi:hypothetical protein
MREQNDRQVMAERQAVQLADELTRLLPGDFVAAEYVG